MKALFSIAAAAALASVAGQAHAEHWIFADVGGGAIAYDEHSLNADIRTGMVAINTVTYYAAPRDAGGQPVNFTAERLVFECRGNRYRWERSAAINIEGVTVAEAPDSDWIEMDQSLGARALYRRIACTTDRPPQVGDAASLEELIAEVPSVIAGAPRAAAAPVAPPPPPEPDVTEATDFDPDALQTLLDSAREANEGPVEPRLRGSSD